MSNSLQFRFVGADGRTEGRHVVVDGIVTFIVREYQMGGMQHDYFDEFFFKFLFIYESSTTTTSNKCST